MARQQESKFVVDTGDVEIHGEHPVNKHEKPISMPEDGDDGQPVALQTDEQEHLVEKEPIEIISDTEEQRLKEEKAAKKPKVDEEDEQEEEGDDDITRELKRQRNRARRQSNKDRQKKAQEYKNAEIRRLNRKIEELESKFDTTTKVSRLDADQNTVQSLKNDAAQRYQRAKQKLSEAFTGGDAVGHATAMEEMFQAQQTFEKADIALKNIDIQKKTPENPRPNSFIEEKRTEFMKNNPWFDDQKKDRDSRIALRISKELLNEEYTPDTEEYWEELEDRITKEIPDKKSQSDDDEEDEEIQVKKPTAKQKLPVSQGGGREAKSPNADSVSVSDVNATQRSILRQMGYAEGTPEWIEMAKVYKAKNQAERNR